MANQTRLCALRAGDRSVLLLFRKGSTADTDPRVRSTTPSAFPGRSYPHGRHGCRSRGLRLSYGKLGNMVAKHFTSAPRRPSAGSGYAGCMEHLLRTLSDGD